jgi:hypothetical protein
LGLLKTEEALVLAQLGVLGMLIENKKYSLRLA